MNFSLRQFSLSKDIDVLESAAATVFGLAGFSLIIISARDLGQDRSS